MVIQTHPWPKKSINNPRQIWISSRAIRIYDGKKFYWADGNT